MPNTIEPRADFSTCYDKFINGSVTNEDKQILGKELLDGLEKDGYVYLTNVGKISEWVEELKECGNSFFALPKETKDKYERSFDTFHGYLYQEKERPDGCPTVHETFDITRLEEVPEEVPNFKTCSKSGFEQLIALLRITFSSLDLALGYEQNFFNDRCTFDDYEKNALDLRVLRHPPMDEPDETPTQRMFSHKDFGNVSLIFQDDVGGLEMQTSSGEWIEASTCIPNGCIMIAGEMMPKVTNGRIPAVEHRVVTKKNGTVERRSVILFVNFDFDVLLKSPTDPVDESTETVRQLITRGMKKVYDKDISA